MAPPDADTEVRASSEAAETFVNSYYEALNRRSKLETFYVNSSPRYSTPADISINGKVVATPEEYSALLDAQGSGVRYEVDSLDAHVINPSFAYSAPDSVLDNNSNSSKVERSGGRVSVVVTIMGKVRFGTGRDAPQKAFNETFVLVPNWDAMARNPPRGLKRWLVMSQNFRAL